MMDYTRRAFAKIAATLSGGLVVTYAQPMVVVKPKNQWIEEHGDFVIIRVPDGKSFARDVISKPAILVVGLGARVEDVTFNNYVNMALKPGSVLNGISVDASNSATKEGRATVVITGKSARLEDWNVVCGANDLYGLSIEDFDRPVVDGLSCTLGATRSRQYGLMLSPTLPLDNPT